MHVAAKHNKPAKNRININFLSIFWKILSQAEWKDFVLSAYEVSDLLNNLFVLLDKVVLGNLILKIGSIRKIQNLLYSILVF